MRLLLVAVVLLSGLPLANETWGDEGANSASADVIFLGARRQDRTERTSIVPVDVLYPEDFSDVGYTDLAQILANLVPSFVFPQPALAGGTDHARPASLRGMAPDKMLVLINGKRRNPSAQMHLGDTMGRGSLGVDLGVIPLASVKRIEILRDGASAQYGSGAMAGVINIVLKDATEGLSLTATFGQYHTHFAGVPDLSQFAAPSSSEFFLFERGDLNTDDGDGDTLTVSVHGGFSLFDDGYLDVSIDFRDQEATNRSGHDPRAIYPTLPNGDWDTREQFFDRRNHVFGNPDVEDFNLLGNFGMPLGAGVEFYGFIGYSTRNARSSDLYRLARDDANIPEVYPDGYLPELRSNSEDRYYTLGFRWQRWGWDWDFSMNGGENEIDWGLANSINASIGSASPTSFSIGNYEGRHQLFHLDLFRFVDVGFVERPVAVAAGIEYRNNEYENEFGDGASTFVGPELTDDGRFRPAGSQGFFGVRPVDDFDDSILTLAAYVEFDAELSDRLGILLAARVDDAEQNTDVSGKLAARWVVSEQWTLTGTVSRDFRTPSAAQTYLLATEAQRLGAGSIFESGIYPGENDPIAQALGADRLDSETSLNIRVGARFQAADNLSFTLDIYQIDVDDRIVLSEVLAGAEVDAILGAAGITTEHMVRYFHNGLDLRTRGIDFTANYDWNSRWGVIQFGAGFNFNTRDITGRATAPAELASLGSDFQRVSATWENQLEEWTPDSKLHLNAKWQGRRLGVNVRAIRYGESTDFGDVPEDDLPLGPVWLLDMNASYALTDMATARMGIHNALDEYTDARPRNTPLNRILPYSNYSPFGFNGRFVYLRVGLNL